MELETQIALLAQKVDALIVRGDERHTQNVGRMEEIRVDVKEMKVEVTKTNGGIADAKLAIAEHEQRITASEGSISRLFSTSTGVVKVADLRIYVAWGFGCALAAVGATLWVLKVAGKV